MEFKSKFLMKTVICPEVDVMAKSSKLILDTLHHVLVLFKCPLNIKYVYNQDCDAALISTYNP